MAYQLHYSRAQPLPELPTQPCNADTFCSFNTLGTLMLHLQRQHDVKIPANLSFSLFNSLLSKEITFNADTLYRRHWPALLIIILLLAFSVEACARDYESIENIRHTMQHYIKNNLLQGKNSGYEIGDLDQRLRLDKCDRPLEIFDSGNTRLIGHSSLGVRCRGSKMWTIHVPINIIRYARVLVVKENLSRGSILHASDLTTRRLNVSRLFNGYFTDRTEVRGKVLKRSLRRGDILTNGMLDVRKLIKRGDIVTIMASSGTLAIRVEGEALMDGRKGDLIRVRNHSSNREIQAVVVATGVVKVSM
ncbi:MAG TPA: flagellar basal body P-ring formation protein FlgA [Gammaproteobacteria bacterium]|nr:flagellar basal body P-ring formation protein FlgA [Gammaproteobacteria bacterium]